MPIFTELLIKLPGLNDESLWAPLRLQLNVSEKQKVLLLKLYILQNKNVFSAGLKILVLSLF